AAVCWIYVDNPSILSEVKKDGLKAQVLLLLVKLYIEFIGRVAMHVFHPRFTEDFVGMNPLPPSVPKANSIGLQMFTYCLDYACPIFERCLLFMRVGI